MNLAIDLPGSAATVTDRDRSRIILSAFLLPKANTDKLQWEDESTAEAAAATCVAEADRQIIDLSAGDASELSVSNLVLDPESVRS